jgi:hypothetical protein
MRSFVSHDHLADLRRSLAGSDGATAARRFELVDGGWLVARAQRTGNEVVPPVLGGSADLDDGRRLPLLASPHLAPSRPRCSRSVPRRR